MNSFILTFKSAVCLATTAALLLFNSNAIAGCVSPHSTYDHTSGPGTTSVSTTTASGGLSAGQTMLVDGDLIIDINWTVDGNSEVYVKQGFSIIIEDGNTMTVSDNSIISAEHDKWDGIIVEPGGRVEVLSKSTISCAVTGIDAFSDAVIGAGDFLLDEANILNNNTGLKVREYHANPHPGIVKNSEFSSPDLYGTGVQGDYGVHIVKVATTAGDGILIGDASGAWGTPGSENTFHDLEIGILSINSNLTVQNCYFHDIQPSTSSWGIGIAAQSDPNTPVELVVGDPLTGGLGFNNGFEQCKNGIVVRDNVQVTILNNEFLGDATPGGSNDMKTGIHVERILSGSVNIVTLNSLSDITHRGIEFVNNSSAEIHIRSNELTNSFDLDDTRAIWVDEPIATILVSSSIDNNDITHFHRGIGVRNHTTDVSDNSIDFYKPTGSGFASGIFVENCMDAVLRANAPIDGNCTAPACSDLNIRGIHIDASARFYATDNEILNCGRGSFALNPSPGGNYVCNSFTDCYRGIEMFDLSVAGIGPVTGPGGEPSDNSWIPGATANRTHSDHSVFTSATTDIDWFHRSPLPATSEYYMDVSLSTFFTPSENPNLNPVSTSSPECSFAHLTNPNDTLGTSSSSLSSPLINVNGTIDFQTLASMRTDFFENDAMISAIDPNVLSLLNVESFILKQEIDSAMVVLNAISPSNKLENNWHSALSILANALDSAQNIDEVFRTGLPLTTKDSSDLLLIANQAGFDGAWGTYYARAILGIVVGDNPMSPSDNYFKIQESVASEISPNPTTDFIYLSAIPENGEWPVIEIFDITGKLTLSETFENGVVDVSGLADGLFIYRITADDGLMSSGKLIKQ